MFKKKYVLNLFANIIKLRVKPCNTLIMASVHLIKDDNDPKKYRQLVEKLNYFIVIRPDIAYTVSVGR